MPYQSTSFSFGHEREPKHEFLLYEYVIEDRGSRYSVSIGRVQSRAEIQHFLRTLKQKKKYAKATHNSWAVRLRHEGALYESKNDDGEAGAGMVILRVLQQAEVANCIVCVTRWFGGVMLMNDRFKHVQVAARIAITRGIE